MNRTPKPISQSRAVFFLSSLSKLTLPLFLSLSSVFLVSQPSLRQVATPPIVSLSHARGRPALEKRSAAAICPQHGVDCRAARDELHKPTTSTASRTRLRIACTTKASTQHDEGREQRYVRACVRKSEDVSRRSTVIDSKTQRTRWPIADRDLGVALLAVGAQCTSSNKRLRCNDYRPTATTASWCCTGTVAWMARAKVNAEKQTMRKTVSKSACR